MRRATGLHSTHLSNSNSEEIAMRNLLFLSLLALPLSGCVVAAVGAGVVASSQMLDNNVYTAIINKDSAVVWNTTKEFLSAESQELIEWDNQTRIATAKLDNSRVTVKVETYDLDKSVLTVAAKKYMSTVNDGEMAKLIMERLQRRLEH